MNTTSLTIRLKRKKKKKAIFYHPESWEKNQTKTPPRQQCHYLIFEEISASLNPMAFDSKILTLSAGEIFCSHIPFTAKQFQVSQGQNFPNSNSSILTGLTLPAICRLLTIRYLWLTANVSYMALFCILREDCIWKIIFRVTLKHLTLIKVLIFFYFFLNYEKVYHMDDSQM